MKLKESKDVFDNIEIPEELEQIVKKTVEEHPRQEAVGQPKQESIIHSRQETDLHLRNENIIPLNQESVLPPNKNKVITFIKYTAAAAAAVLIFFTTALNSNQAFAEAAGSIPIIGKVAEILTVRSYSKVEDNTNITVQVPEVGVKDDQASTGTEDDQTSTGTEEDQTIAGTEDNQAGTGTDAEVSDTGSTGNDNQFVADINAEINKLVDQYTADAEVRRQADKEAFIATGGTEEEWATRDLNINVGYEVKYQQGGVLSFVLTADESWYGAYDLTYYYNLNLEENRNLTLEDLLGGNYQEIAKESIINQMKERVVQDKNYVYWGVAGETEPSGIPGFTTVDENTKFYINSEGKPVVCFAKYEIAPGFMGNQEFVIK